jgi:hypothetical protein
MREIERELTAGGTGAAQTGPGHVFKPTQANISDDKATAS